MKNNIDFHRNNTDYNHSDYSTAYYVLSLTEMRYFVDGFLHLVQHVSYVQLAQHWKKVQRSSSPMYCHWFMFRATPKQLEFAWEEESEKDGVIVDHSTLSTLNLLCFNLDEIQNDEEGKKRKLHSTGGKKKQLSTLAGLWQEPQLGNL